MGRAKSLQVRWGVLQANIYGTMDREALLEDPGRTPKQFHFKCTLINYEVNVAGVEQDVVYQCSLYIYSVANTIARRAGLSLTLIK